MKNKKIILFSLLMLTTLFISYAVPFSSIKERNPYEIFGDKGKYFINKTFDIFVSGTPYDSYNDVERKAFYTAGQIAYENGCEYFVILDDTISSEITDYTDIQIHEDAWGNISASGGKPIKQSSGIMTIVIFTSEEAKELDIPIYRALDYYDSRDSIPTDYKHQIQFLAGYVPIPDTGWTINGTYNYIFKNFGIGLGIDYDSYEIIKPAGEYSHLYERKTYFSVSCPLKFYILKPNTHNFLYMDICAAPSFQHHTTESNGYEHINQKETINGFSTDLKYELGFQLELATFDLYIDYNLSTIESVLSVGGGFSFFIR